MDLRAAETETLASDVFDVIERLAATNDWTFERLAEDEININLKGSWTDYHVSVTWMDEVEALHLACAFEMKVPEPRRAEAAKLVAMINEQIWVGHFDMWEDEALVLYRNALLLAGGAEASDEQCRALLAAASETCERYYQAFQFVVWAGKRAGDAFEATIFETVGRA